MIIDTKSTLCFCLFVLRLGYTVNEFWATEGNEPIAALADDGCFPASILVENCVATWLAVVSMRD